MLASLIYRVSLKVKRSPSNLSTDDEDRPMTPSRRKSSLGTALKSGKRKR